MGGVKGTAAVLCVAALLWGAELSQTGSRTEMRTGLGWSISYGREIEQEIKQIEERSDGSAQVRVHISSVGAKMCSLGIG